MSRPGLLIAGGGLVGHALACAARDFDVRVVEASAARAAAPPDEYDVRVYALSAGTRAFLREIGAWERLDANRIAPVERMEVAAPGGASLAFTAPTRAPLAWIVEAGRLAAALEACTQQLANVSVLRGVTAASFGASASGGWIGLANGERLEASLLVGADGADSAVRAALGIAAEERPYGETAFVANFETQRGHGGVARQWFRGDGVLAWLPLPGPRMSIVWSAREALARELAALDEREFTRRVQEAGASALGDLALVSRVARFPLRLIRVPRPVAPGVVLVGDAAHAVHPLAGQGVNLGFQDAKLLAGVLAGRSPLERPGDLRLLRRYARARREDVAAMQFVTDGLDRIFAEGRPGAAALANLGLALVDSLPWAKRALAARAMR